MNELFMFSDRMRNMNMIRDMNIDLQRMSGIIYCDETQRLSILNWLKNMWNYVPFTVGRGKTRMDDRMRIEAIRPDIPIVFDKLTDVQKSVWNEFLTWAGINNNNIDKRERVSNSEVLANNEEIIIARESALIPRRQFAEKFNDMFGTNIEPMWRCTMNLSDIFLNGEKGGGIYGFSDTDDSRSQE